MKALQRQNIIQNIWKSDFGIIILFALVKLLLHLLFSGNYGFFRDELYFIACSKHLDIGYVDQPSFIAIIAFLSRNIFGVSLFAYRLFPAITDFFIIMLSGLMAKELGGNRFAIVLAMICTLISPILLGIGHIMTMNVFDHLFWTLSAYILIKIFKTRNYKLFLLLGFIFGIGLNNKYSMIFFIISLVIAVSFTKYRTILIDKFFWLTIAITIILILPNFFWQLIHAFPFLELMTNAKYKNIPNSPGRFLLSQFLELHPLNSIILLLGLVFFLFSRHGKSFRIFGFSYLFIFSFYLITQAKTYFISPIYPLMLAGGAVQLSKLLLYLKRKWIHTLINVVFIASGILTMPFAFPLLKIDQYITYSSTLGIKPMPMENKKLAGLPQHFADMFGWEEFVKVIAHVYHSLPEEEKKKTGIYASNFGNAGAVDYFGLQYDLPTSMCSHNNYWFWGPDNNAETVIAIGGKKEFYKSYFEIVQEAEIFQHPYVLPNQNNLSIYICRKLLLPFKAFWSSLKLIY